MAALTAVHISDLHLSRYGETGTWTARDRDDARGWVALHTWQRWVVEGCRDRKGRPDRLRLVDPEGVIHKERSWPSRKDDRALSALLTTAMERHRTSAERLCKDPPSLEDLDSLMRLDPRNTNLRFLKLMQAVWTQQPDAIMLTGDITDNGFGYDLVKFFLGPWIDKRRLFVVPGNHDTYDMLPRMGRRRRAQMKVERYRRFADAVGMPAGPSGAFLRHLDDVAVVGLDSCQMPVVPLSASGEVPREQLDWMRALGDDPAFSGARLRVGLIHHHLLRMPYRAGRGAPVEVGLRLRNAEDTMEALTQAGFDLVLNGHRHLGYAVKLPGRPLVVSSPSSTMGCKSTDDRSYLWRLDLTSNQPFPTMEPLPYASTHLWTDGL